MNWQNIKVSEDNTHFLFEGEQLFEKHFIEVLKFHSPGIAPVKDSTGSYHINIHGEALYTSRYSRVFGFYCNRATVVKDKRWFHINEYGDLAHINSFAWSGNYQENLCTVRDSTNRYFHIDKNGEKSYKESFIYAGDYKDGYACVKRDNGFYKHIDTKGNFLNNKEFLDLGIFHKNYATAKDHNGWHHTDKQGEAVYSQRYAAVEPFYNGFALVTQFDNKKIIIDEKGVMIVSL